MTQETRISDQSIAVKIGDTKDAMANLVQFRATNLSEATETRKSVVY